MWDPRRSALENRFPGSCDSDCDGNSDGGECDSLANWHLQVVAAVVWSTATCCLGGCLLFQALQFSPACPSSALINQEPRHAAKSTTIFTQVAVVECLSLDLALLLDSPFSNAVNTMTTKTLEARFEHLSVNDENEMPTGTSLKSKVVYCLVRSINLVY